MSEAARSRTRRGWQRSTAAMVFAVAAGVGFLATAPCGGRESRAKAPPTPAQPAWVPANEWLVAGNYAEACSDAPLCGAFFGSAPCGGDCRKILIFQVTRGRYRNTDLSGLSAVVAVESPPGAPIRADTRKSWRRADLYISDAADSAQATALGITLRCILSGPDGPPFGQVRTVPLGVGFTMERVFAEIPEVLMARITPMKSMNGLRAPDLNNLDPTFPFLGVIYAYKADSLFYAGGGDPRAYSGRSAAVGPFTWSSEAAAAATKPAPQKTTK